mmetsp:Transcript_9808/g.23322  ORF Transcript_9808/g.23322 Transcript_9808/m.23322 type:complete len:245 (-) Transcript_9808:456-1190(-)
MTMYGNSMFLAGMARKRASKMLLSGFRTCSVTCWPGRSSPLRSSSTFSGNASSLPTVRMMSPRFRSLHLCAGLPGTICPTVQPSRITPIVALVILDWPYFFKTSLLSSSSSSKMLSTLTSPPGRCLNGDFPPAIDVNSTSGPVSSGASKLMVDGSTIDTPLAAIALFCALASAFAFFLAALVCSAAALAALTTVERLIPAFPPMMFPFASNRMGVDAIRIWFSTGSTAPKLESVPILSSNLRRL